MKHIKCVVKRRLKEPSPRKKKYNNKLQPVTIAMLVYNALNYVIQVFSTVLARHISNFILVITKETREY